MLLRKNNTKESYKAGFEEKRRIQSFQGRVLVQKEVQKGWICFGSREISE